MKMANLRRDLTYSRQHTGVLTVTGSTGENHPEANDTIDTWLEENALGEIDWGGTEGQAHLLAAKGATYAVRSSMEKMEPSWPTGNGQEFTYDRVVQVRLSPANASIPDSFRYALGERNLIERHKDK